MIKVYWVALGKWDYMRMETMMNMEMNRSTLTSCLTISSICLAMITIRARTRKLWEGMWSSWTRVLLKMNLTMSTSTRMKKGSWCRETVIQITVRTWLRFTWKMEMRMMWYAIRASTWWSSTTRMTRELTTSMSRRRTSTIARRLEHTSSFWKCADGSRKCKRREPSSIKSLRRRYREQRKRQKQRQRKID